MQILHLELENFKRYSELHLDFNPNFNLLVGPNGAGKTTTLDALSVPLGAWVRLMNKGTSKKNAEHFARLEGFGQGTEFRLAPQYPVHVEVSGNVLGKEVSWYYNRVEGQNTPESQEDQGLRDLAVPARNAVMKGGQQTLPVITYYGVDRSLSNEGELNWRSTRPITNRDILSRLTAYRNCLVPRVTSEGLAQFLLRDALFDRQSEEWPAGNVVREAMVKCIPGAKDVRFDASRFELIVDIEPQGPLPMRSLSDGQRSMLAMVGDLAQRMAQLNPHLGADVLQKTPGVVLIDELDLHLHPRWQRTVVANLKSVFPKVQFFATTHSPQIIGEVPAEQVLLLKPDGGTGHPVATFGMDANDVLIEVQGAESSNTEVASLAHEVRQKLMDLDVDGASQLLVTLRSLAEQPNPQTSELESELLNVIALLKSALEDVELDSVTRDDSEVKG